MGSVKMSELSEREKALIILKQCSERLDECSKQMRELRDEFYSLQEQFTCASRKMKRVLNEEENNGNIHKNCKWYREDSDSCYNYMMATGLAFEVSRHKTCIDDIIKKECDER